MITAKSYDRLVTEGADELVRLEVLLRDGGDLKVVNDRLITQARSLYEMALKFQGQEESDDTIPSSTDKPRYRVETIHAEQGTFHVVIDTLADVQALIILGAFHRWELAAARASRLETEWQQKITREGLT